MKEITFNNRNRERWVEYEKALSGKTALSPDQTGDMYIQVTDDLAFSKTFFPEGHTTRYLNSLASRFHLKVYAKKKEKGSKLLRFWAVDLPLLFYKTRKELILSSVIFFVALLIGILSATNDERFIRSVLGDEYVNRTLHNIATGNPLAVYQTMGEWEMFFSIAFNNIYVMFLVFFVWRDFIAGYNVSVVAQWGDDRSISHFVFPAWAACRFPAHCMAPWYD
ncbi:MAG: hypothetical protein V2A54_00200 [Bacteroidota bacterium]